MSKINVLDKKIFNLIAAGEVVEKPASVVKELVENSIDAGSTLITIEVKNGGRYIRISDNGCGIEKDDLINAFLPHATSKISTQEDLTKIGTLGFRGEALSSIASVSKVTMLSKTNDSDGNKIYLEGGEVISIEPVGCTNGTSITVDELFYNVPARAKFLRKDKTEEGEITNYVSRLILSNENISIKYILNDKIVYHSQGKSLFDSIYTVYGKNIVDNIADFEYSDDNFIIRGYIGNPTFSKPNRTYQTLIVNGRYVINASISSAIYKAYENFIMRGTFPFYVLHIKLPLDKVDVNVHPNKLEVKFENTNGLYGILFSAVTTRLYDIHAINTIGYSELRTANKNQIVDSRNNDEQEENFDTFISKNPEFKTYADKQKEELSDDFIKPMEPQRTLLKYKDIDVKNDKMFKDNLQTITELISTNTMDFKIQNNDLAYSLAEQLTLKQKEVMPKVESRPELALSINDFKIIGTVFNTYILVEQDNTMYLIDQHAAHERLLFDKFKTQFEERGVSIQDLLVPYVIDTNELEKIYINDNLEELKMLGFEVEPFGSNTFKINTVPLTLKNINIQAFFADLLGEIASASKITLSQSDIMWDYIAKSACKAAVKANDILSDNEIKVLLTNLTGNEKQVLLCPHGRPIIIKITKNDIEKWFKRLV